MTDIPSIVVEDTMPSRDIEDEPEDVANAMDPSASAWGGEFSDW